MIQSVTIEAADGVRQLDADDLPLTIGSAEGSHLRVAGNPANAAVVALVGLAEGVPYVQPVKNASITVRQNGRLLLTSSWLQDGDILECGGSQIRCRMSAQRLVFRVETSPTAAGARASRVATAALPVREAPPLPVPAPLTAGHPAGHLPLRARLVKFLLLTIFGLLLIAAWFLFAARFVPMHIDPLPDHMAIDGGLIHLPIADGYLLYPGHYRLRAEKAGYYPLETTFEVAKGNALTITQSLQKLPGKLRIGTGSVTGAEVSIDGALRGRAPLLVPNLDPGPHEVLIQAPRYFDLRRKVKIEGMAVEQRLEVSLVPRWASITVHATPAGAWLWVDGERLAPAPLSVDLLQGSRELEVRKPGFKPWRQTVEVVANQPQTLPEVRLEPADGKLRVISQPTGASVTVAGEYAGQTPVEILVPADEVQEVRVSKAGYQEVNRTASVQSGAEASLSITLSAVMGTVEVVAEPTDAELFVDGKARGRASQRLSLAAVSHRLEIRKAGYRTFRTGVTPRVGYPQVVKVRLEPVNVALGAARPREIEGPNGHRLRLLEPATITMGASRREQGRRGNETLRKVVLTRPFYLGVKEVTNEQFRQFEPKHYPAPFQGQALSSDHQPVVNVTWEQAAAYCNWLSAKASLPAVYERSNGKLVAKRPLPGGYRLPTEAEWARAARFAASSSPSTFPWGNELPPPPNAGNYADDAASTILGNTIRAYHDGYTTTAPVGSFDPSPLGLYDLGGNVAEWTHDYYAIYPAGFEQVYTDPLGPADGRHHVIRGASWMHASPSALRWTFRDYSDQPRPDVGFRIARNVN